MFGKMKMSYDMIRQKMGSSIDKAVKSSVKRYSESELKEACLSEDKAHDLASRVYFQLPERIKSNFMPEAKDAFIKDVVSRLMNTKNTKKGQKKLYGA